jgi:hypothetical protein
MSTKSCVATISSLLAFLTLGCASLSADSITVNYKQKEELILQGSLQSNFDLALQILPECHKALDQAVTTLVPGVGSIQSSDRLTAEITDEPGRKTILLGNSVKGATGFYEFAAANGNTALTAYSAEWYKVDEKLFYQFLEALKQKDASLCE